MTQITEEQQHQLEAASVRVAAKLLTFHAGLPADEQLMLDLAFCRLVAGDEAAIGEELDAQGHMIAHDRLRPSPEGTGGGGGLSLGQLAIGFLGLLSLGSGLSTPGPAGDPPPPGQPPLY